MRVTELGVDAISPEQQIGTLGQLRIDRGPAPVVDSKCLQGPKRP